jgi:hypothetical protein
MRIASCCCLQRGSSHLRTSVYVLFLASGGGAAQTELVSGLLSRVTDGLPVASRWFLALSLAFLIPTLLPLGWIAEPLVDTAAFCVAPLYDGSASLVASLLRFVLSPLLHTALSTGLLSCFALYVLCPRIEQQRGTVVMLTLYAALLVLTQAVHTLLTSLSLSQAWLVSFARDSLYIDLHASYPSEHLRIPILGAHPASLHDAHESEWRQLTSISIPTQACVVNNYAMIFALLVIECKLFTKDTRRQSVGSFLAHISSTHNLLHVRTEL